ncbi:hypothetical protein [Rhodococcus rhodochrous]|uniref:Secreted protein n=1 Tax=Rhodococcus rhodochrous TaxID=1829 RepID=A0AA46WVC9_RHORH|nr:hypothetical protein [Rhodococcus rhodochrous]UZF44444.1 hypothetical protein KUM34_021725 [Rhodococcus rhodochrous]
MNHRRTLRATVSLLAPLALLAGFASAASAAADTDTRGLWTVSTRGDTVLVKLMYTSPPDEDYPFICVAALGTGESGIAEIFGANYQTLEFTGIAAGLNIATASCEDNDGELRPVGAIEFELPGPPTLHYVATESFWFDDADDD